METLTIQIGQILTLDELCNEMGIEAGNLSDNDIKAGIQCNVDNYNGDKGFNVDFDLITANENDNAYEFTVKITDIYSI